MAKIEQLVRDLPDPEGARRFLAQLEQETPAAHAKLLKGEGLLSDVLTLVSFSPLLATTLLQNPEYLWWLARKRVDSGVRGKDELVESLARFSLTNSQVEPQVLYSRFRRRELIRIYLRDIRGLATIAEITEEISNLADAILEAALKEARREMDNRYGLPQEADEKGRAITARFCIVALGKLGSKELNYSSDIDLLFVYSGEGNTSGNGSRGSVTNREYFVKLSEYIVKLVGHQTGEGAAYRVDLRLRPHGSLGAITQSIGDVAKYCRTEARAWERQVLIRSRGCAGDVELFKQFFSEVEDMVFSRSETVSSALSNVRRSKERIDLENILKRGYDVKLGRGGIREIEFLAQALQLAYGGRDKWLRSSHTLISLTRLADRKHLSDTELTELSAAYAFLRRTEHVLQMKNGVQTHTVPDDPEKRAVLARRVMFTYGGDFEQSVAIHTENVSRVFRRVFGEIDDDTPTDIEMTEVPDIQERTLSHVMASIEKSNVRLDEVDRAVHVLNELTRVSPHFSAMLAANPDLAAMLPDPDDDFEEPDYGSEMLEAVESERDFGARLSAMRRTWSRFLLTIVVRDVFEKITIRESKRLQTLLAEASVSAALKVVRDELAFRYRERELHLDLAILALGKLGGRGIDYDSDLDLIVVYFDPTVTVTPRERSGLFAGGLGAAEFYAKAVELFTTTLSSMTRDGNLYRVDLRLRPFGSKGMSAMSIDGFLAYMGETAAIWELLAFVKLRAVGGDASLGFTVESETRRLIHDRASSIDPEQLRLETRKMRLALENERSKLRRESDINIKYGAGGMLDIYFAMRYLQLRDNIPDEATDRSTPFMLKRILENGSISEENFAAMNAGYEFLAAFDHNLRLTVGRTTRVPLANHTALANIAQRMQLASESELLEQLTLHRLAIRDAFNEITGVTANADQHADG
jgi:glutamate-ammonia-ligase adenylyltransferase